MIPQDNDMNMVLSNSGSFMELMKGKGIVRVETRFDGCGDSGQIEYHEAFDGDGNEMDGDVLKTSVGKIKFLRSYSIDANGKMVPNYELKDGTIEDVLEEVAYAMLEKKHDGWEINEGSFGTFTFDFVAGTISLEYNERVESVNTTNSMFDFMGKMKSTSNELDSGESDAGEND